MGFAKLPARWLWAGVAALWLAGCGGGGSGDAPAPPAPPPDARNGDYKAFAADGYQYTLSLNFDAKTWRMSGNGLDAAGSLAAESNYYVFNPAPAGAAVNTARFTQANDTVIGGFAFSKGAVLPFVAPRAFINTLAEAAGTYNFLARTVDTATTAPAAPDNAIFTGLVSSGGQMSTCNDATIYAIEKCPVASVVTGTVTVVGDEFTNTTPGGAYSFRIARIGTDKVFLRASASTGTTRRFWVGTVNTASYAPGSFSGANTQGYWGTTTVTATSHTATAVTPSGATATRTGTAQPVAPQPSQAIGPSSLMVINTADVGNYFSIRAANIGAIAAARGNAVLPGYFEVGRP